VIPFYYCSRTVINYGSGSDFSVLVPLVKKLRFLRFRFHIAGYILVPSKLTLFLLKNIKEAGSRTVITSYGLRGKNTLTGRRGGWGVNILEDGRHTVALYSTYIDCSLVLGLFLRNLVLKISVKPDF
jgi:hypothetical protein